MPDEYEDAGTGSKKKLPTWVFIAAGGGILLLLLTNKGSKSSTATDNLLMAEIDATLKSLQERMEADQKSYRDEQLQAWEDWKQSISEMLGGGKYTSPPPNTYPPVGSEPGSGDYDTMPGKFKKEKENTSVLTPGGSGSKDILPSAIDGAMFDNYIFGFNYSKAKR